ncbi:MAG: hypothetical protein IH609_14980 [Dehalococcoidia bacterium]|nr:hypothetical protein [Dehalococcoidia bacterium]
MLQDPILIYEDARRRHQERLVVSARRSALREQYPDSGLRSQLAGALRRAADAVDGRQGSAWCPPHPVEDA